MSNRCPKCNRELARASLERTGPNTLAPGLLVCSHCGTATLSSEGNVEDTFSFEPATAFEQIAHFKLDRLLGSGGFGDVWLAIDTKLGRAVALKLSKSRRREMSTLLFEAQTAASLRHPHIVSVHEVGEVDGQVYIASDLIEGMTLGDLLSAGKPPLPRTIEIMIPIVRALHFAHTRGVYHRDVKPANILLDHAGQPYVTDFGLAKRASDTSSSSEGRMVGTVRYMSPEQAVGNFGETDGRSDVYALGVTLFEMLTGETPFRGNAQAILHQKAFDDPPSPRTLEPNLPKDLETICLKCLERDPGKRFQSADELAEELERYAANEPIRSRPISRAERTWRWCQKRPAISGLLAGLFLSLTAGLLGVTYFWRTSVVHETAARHSLYRSWMNMAAIHLRMGDMQGVRDALSRIGNDPRLMALRRFEWNYFDDLMEPITVVGSLGTRVIDVAVTHDGQFCAATGGEREIRVWEVKTGEPIRTLTADVPGFQALDFSPSTAQLAAGSADGFVRLYDPLAKSQMVRQFRHGPPVTLVCFSSDGRQLAACGKTGAVRLWDPIEVTLIAEVPTGKREATTAAIRFSPDSLRLFVASTDGHVRVWDTKSLRTVGTKAVPMPMSEHDMATGSITAFSVSDDGQQLYSGNFYGFISSLSLADGTSSTYQSRWGLITGIEPVAHSHLLAVATNDGLLHLYNRVIRNDVRAIHSHGLAEAKLARSHAGNVLVIGSGDGSVSALDVADIKQPNILWHPDQRPVRSVAFIGHAEKLLAGYDDGDLWLWNTETGAFEILIDEVAGGLRLIAVDSRGERFATAAPSGVQCWDAKSLKVLEQISGPSTGVSAIRFSATGKLLAVAYRSGRIRVYDSTAWTKPLLNLEFPGNPTSALEFTPDETALVVGDTDKIHLVEIRSGEAKASLALGLEPTALVYCNDTDEFAIGANSGAIAFCDPALTGLRAVIKAHTGRIHTMADMPDSPTLVTAGRDKVLKLWDLPSKELNTALSEHFRQVFAVAISDDGKTLASGSLEGDVRIWRTQ
ncbi:MAG: WD40 repeat domain-containing serine/threonine protein kinase [Planctomycetaceae bacterium]